MANLRFQLLLPGVVLEHGDEMVPRRAVDRDGEPLLQRLEIELESLGDPRSRDPAIFLEQLRTRSPNAREDVGHLSADDVLESRQPAEGGVHVQVDEVRRAVVLVVEHPAVRESLEHVLEQRPIAVLETPQRLFCPLPLRDVARDAENADPAAVIVDETHLQLGPHRGAVLAGLLELGDVVDRRRVSREEGLQARGQRLRDQLVRLGRQNVFQGHGSGFLDCVAEELLDRRTEVGELPRPEIEDPEDVGDQIEEQPKACLAVPGARPVLERAQPPTSERASIVRPSSDD